ncbi:MAG: PDR/VanB family oxidoreductase [Micromonosporaceae bacterium]
MSEAGLDLKLLVQQMTWEAEGVLSLRLNSATGQELPTWRPGAHIDLVLPGGLTRQYSLLGAPEDRTHYEIAVLREPGGSGGSRYVHESLRPGTVVSVRGPRNNFELEDAPGYLFVAGGIGVTPILPMIAEAHRYGRPWELLYGGRARGSMAFADRLTRYGERVTLAPQDEHGLLDLERALTRRSQLSPDAQVYACGPEPLLTALEKHCAPLGDILRVERFKAPVEAAAGRLPSGALRVTLARTNRTLAVDASESILVRLLEAGVKVPNDCRDGICGSCQTRVLQGEPDHRDYVLTNRQRRAGDTMMVCVSRCVGEELVLDL